MIPRARRMGLAGLLVCVATTGGCLLPSMAMLRRAEPVPPGWTRVRFQVGADILPPFASPHGPPDTTDIVLPDLHLAGRLGISRRFDAGLTLDALGPSLLVDARLLLLRTGWLGLAIDPTVGAGLLPEPGTIAYAGQASLPVLVGVHLPRGIEIVIGPRIGGYLESSGFTPILGGGIGVHGRGQVGLDPTIELDAICVRATGWACLAYAGVGTAF